MDDSDNIYMRSCTSIMIGPHNSVHDGNIYQLNLLCDKYCPKKPPNVRLCYWVNMTFVIQAIRRVEPKHFSMLPNWSNEYIMEDMLS